MNETINRENIAQPMTWAQLQEGAKGNWSHIFAELAPKLLEAVTCAPNHVPCPVHGGDNGYRLFDHFNDTGRGICNTCGPQKSGVATLAWVKGCSMAEATAMVQEWLTKEKSQPPAIERKAFVAPPKLDPAVAYARLREVWKSSLPLGGAAEAYLVNRGIWRENLPSVLRAHAGLTYIHGKEKKNYGKFPCLLAPIRDKANQIVSIHRIYLTEDGQKAPVPDAKKMMSPCAELRGAAIKLFPPGKTLGLAEGVETALAAHAVSRMPVWSCVSAVLMELVEVPDSVEHVVIWTDLDRSQRGIQAAERLADRMEALGKTVEICVPQGPIPEGVKGIDWLDVMLTKGLNGFPAKWRRWRPSVTQVAA